MEKTDVNNTALTIFFLAAAVMLIGGLAVTPALQEVQAQPPDRFAGSDRCVSSQDQSDVVTSTCTHGTDREEVKDISREQKESCQNDREQGLVDKCSSSQTGFGEFCNWDKVKRDRQAAVIGGEPPCNDENQILNSFLNNK